MATYDNFWAADATDKSLCMSVVSSVVYCGLTVQDRPIGVTDKSYRNVGSTFRLVPVIRPLQSPNGELKNKIIIWHLNYGQTVGDKAKLCIDRYAEVTLHYR